MNRRGFLAVLTTPLIVQPMLEDIERLTWKRRFFPGYSPPAIDDQMLLGIYKLIATHALTVLEPNLFMARLVNRDYENQLAQAGDTIAISSEPQKLIRT